MSNHYHSSSEFFQGERFHSSNPPFNYIPIWISITTPPVTFLLGIIGMISVFGRGFIYPRDILRNTQLRFGFLLVACFMLPILGVIMMNSTLYNGWRQMYFLYAPFSVLAVFGLHYLVTYSKRILFGEWIVYGLVGTGIIATVISMILLHPFQHLYFNFLVDRTSPEHLKQEYYMWDWGTGGLIVLKHLTEQYPSSNIHIDPLSDRKRSILHNRMILPEYDRKRIVLSINSDLFNINTDTDRNNGIGNFSYFVHPHSRFLHENNTTLTYKVYNNTVFGIEKLTVPKKTTLEKITLYKSILAGDAGRPVDRSAFDIYQDGTTLIYIKEMCSREDTWTRFFLHVYPSDDADLGADRIEYRTNNLDFDFMKHGIFVDGGCLAVITLPDYDITRIRTGQYISGRGRLWEVNFIPAKR